MIATRPIAVPARGNGRPRKRRKRRRKKRRRKGLRFSLFWKKPITSSQKGRRPHSVTDHMLITWQVTWPGLYISLASSFGFSYSLFPSFLFSTCSSHRMPAIASSHLMCGFQNRAAPPHTVTHRTIWKKFINVIKP